MLARRCEAPSSDCDRGSAKRSPRELRQGSGGAKIGLPPGIPTPGIPTPKIVGIPVVGIKGYRPGIPTIEYIEHRVISRWQHTCHIVSTPIIVGH